MPEYEYKLISRSEETTESKVIASVKDTVNTTYRYYAITLDGETKGILNSEEEANEVIKTVKEGLNEEVKFNLGIAEVFLAEENKADKTEITNSLNTLKLAKVEEYEKEKAEKARIEARNKSIARARVSVPTSGVSGSINGVNLVIPVNGTITSRFGNVSSIRSSVHTGLDISTSRGTGIRPIASGVVTYAAYKGSYGNLLIIDHGNGVQSYYAHCNALYVGVGQTVDTNSVVASVGSTGNSTGPHLHLEIRVNGSPVNPQSYIY